jgi:TolA-binding protein
MTTTNANNNYMSGSSVYEIDITAVLNEASTNASSVIHLLNNQINNLNKEIEKWNGKYPASNMTSIYNVFQTTIRLQETQIREKKEADEKIRLEVEVEAKEKAKE